MPTVTGARDRSYPWVFYTSAGLLFGSTVLRASLLLKGWLVLLVAFVLLFVWLVFFVSERIVRRVWPRWSGICLVAEMVIVVSLLSLSGTNDFFAVLFSVVAMQALQDLPLPLGVAIVALFVPLTALPLLHVYDGPQVAALMLVYMALNVFLGGYAVATSRAAEARSHNRALAIRLADANTELRGYSEQLQRLAVAQERNRVARDVHDSVTQTIFSMNLASQSASLLLQRDPSAVDAQLDRLAELTQRALTEARSLVTSFPLEGGLEADLESAIRREIERRARDGLTVRLLLEDTSAGPEVARSLSVAEEHALLRIAQEALNNAVKHSGVSEASISLRRGDPVRMVVEDAGRGFDPRQAVGMPGIGLAGMSERAAEIGWDLHVVSSDGRGTRVIVERPRRREAIDGG